MSSPQSSPPSHSLSPSHVFSLRLTVSLASLDEQILHEANEKKHGQVRTLPSPPPPPVCHPSVAFSHPLSRACPSVRQTSSSLDNPLDSPLAEGVSEEPSTNRRSTSRRKSKIEMTRASRRSSREISTSEIERLQRYGVDVSDSDGTSPPSQRPPMAQRVPSSGATPAERGSQARSRSNELPGESRRQSAHSSTSRAAPMALPPLGVSGIGAAPAVSDAVARVARRVELLDTTADGRPDTLAVDTSGDGVADTMIPITGPVGGDEVARRVELLDTTADGLPDTLAIDTVGDGVADKFVRLRSNEAAEAVAQASRRVEFVDSSGDGRPDTVAIDTVGDGVVDTVIPLARTASSQDISADVSQVHERAELVDTTGDGRPDTLAVDTNGDGQADQFIALRKLGADPGPTEFAVKEFLQSSAPSQTPPPSPPTVVVPETAPASPKASPTKGGSPKSPKIKVTDLPDGRRWSLADALPSVNLNPTRWSIMGMPLSAKGGGGAATPNDDTKASRTSKPNTPLATPSASADVPMPILTTEQLMDMTPLRSELSAFMAKHGLTPEASAELDKLVERSCKTMATQAQASGPVCRWDQIHDMIVTNSPNAALVVINLPDPPELDHGLQTAMQKEEKLKELVGYMEYMDGLVENLPRALYVHGSGQEIINLEHIE